MQYFNLLHIPIYYILQNLFLGKRSDGRATQAQLICIYEYSDHITQ